MRCIKCGKACNNEYCVEHDESQKRLDFGVEYSRCKGCGVRVPVAALTNDRCPRCKK